MEANLAKERKVQYKDKEVTALTLEFESKAEGWSQYLLEDGTTIKMKVILLDAKRIVDEYSEDGNPVYQVQAHYILGIDAPDNLKKKKS